MVRPYAKKGQSIGVVIALIVFLAVGLIMMILYFAGTGLMPRITNELAKLGIVEKNLSAEEPPVFDISPQMLEERRTDIFGRGFSYDVMFAGEFDINRGGFEWGSFGILARTRPFRIEKRFRERETPTGERELVPGAGHITDGREGIAESDIWSISTVTLGRIRLAYRTEQGVRTLERSFRPQEDGETRVMLTVPYTLSGGEKVQIDIAELRYLGLSENKRRIRYRIVPSYSQETISTR